MRLKHKTNNNRAPGGRATAKKSSQNNGVIFWWALCDTIYEGNNNLVRMSDEVWVLDEVSNGVLAEVITKKQQGGSVKYFRHYSDKAPITYRRVSPDKVEFEPPRLGDEDLQQYRDKL